MTLLDSISRAVMVAEAGGTLSPLSKFSIVLNADDIFHQLKPDSEDHDGAFVVKHVSGWKISDAKIAELAASFAKTLKHKLKNTRSFDQGKFLELLNSFLRNNAFESYTGFDAITANSPRSNSKLPLIFLPISNGEAGMKEAISPETKPSMLRFSSSSIMASIAPAISSTMPNSSSSQGVPLPALARPPPLPRTSWPPAISHPPSGPPPPPRRITSSPPSSPARLPLLLLEHDIVVRTPCLSV